VKSEVSWGHQSTLGNLMNIPQASENRPAESYRMEVWFLQAVYVRQQLRFQALLAAGPVWCHVPSNCLSNGS
jgi:hypothetical protein